MGQDFSERGPFAAGLAAQQVNEPVQRTVRPTPLGVKGVPADIANDDSQTRINMLESIRPDTVSVWSSLGHFESAHWGEIMSNAARERR